MKKRILYPLICSAMSVFSTSAVTANTIDPEEELAYNLGIQAFIYGAGPLTTSQVRKTSTTTSVPLNNGMAPMNQMGKTLKLSGPETRIVPTVNNDTLYSQSHINLNETGPLVIEVPVTDNRYFIVQLLDNYTESVENLITENVGTQGGKFLLVNKGWQGDVPEDIDRVIESRTPFVWYIQRVGVAGERDLKAANKVNAGFINYPLTQLGQPQEPVQLSQATGGIPPMTRPEGLDWYKLIDQELRNNPISSDSPIVDQFKYINIGQAQPFDEENLSEAQKRGLMRALSSAQQIISYAGRDLGVKNNGWSMMYEGGVYETDYLSRASINFRAAGLNTKERALYPNRYTDSNEQQLDGKYEYRMTMPADAPAKAFWSVTMYDAKDLYMIENPIDRYSISSNRPDELVYNRNGTLTLCIQHKQPTEANCNWLPAPKDDFYLHMRLYEPSEAVLKNQYQLPEVFKK
ncbi:phosphatidylserine decarboxylase [Shewanella sediminis HAW-EB3]|uniref:Phosphatidylserine decarboxylase n=1 Tax=Shewanella sediminis (strain HAW-EB3) TaxID=425104 RepID=A8G0G7_SHESH|nr:DUF1254 domain-containing protein [Shewanella sediminis]ABV38590.1 phosphatidylserine decarboxylase [Shewanella sediminis HAW-EB3]